jgi:hypothetical protein
MGGRGGLVQLRRKPSVVDDSSVHSAVTRSISRVLQNPVAGSRGSIPHARLMLRPLPASLPAILWSASRAEFDRFLRQPAKVQVFGGGVQNPPFRILCAFAGLMGSCSFSLSCSRSRSTLVEADCSTGAFRQ